jgi:predicted amidohydrolase YtcJ
MRATVFPSVLLALAAFVGQGSPPRTPADSAPKPAVDPRARPAIFHGGKIVLNDGKGTVTEALLARGGKVLAVGRLADIERNPDAQNAVRVDLLGSTAVPGLQDAHGHLVSYGNSLVDVDLRGCKSFAEVVERVAARASVEKEGVWIRGRGWDQNLWEDKSFPHHAALSDKTPKNPVLLARVDGHAAIANRLALAAAKLDRPFEEEPKVQGGRILVDEGRATGVLVDRGMELVEKCIPAPSRATIEARILAAQERLLAFGLTCVHDMGTSRDELEVLKDLRAHGRLRLRVVSYFAGTDELTDAMVADLPLLPDAGDMLSCPGVKLIADGALGSRGAALLADYSDAPGERGQMILDERALSERLAVCQRHGLQPAIHAIGDRANRTVLDVYETLETVHPTAKDLRPRIEHAQVVSLKDWPRFPALGVVPSMQPVHAISDMPWAVARLGKERTRGAYAWRELAPELRSLAFGSDFPVESPDPLPGLHAARTRPTAPTSSGDDAPTPSESMDGGSALAGFTSGAAFACHQEDRRGRLLPGYACDMTVLTVNPVSCEPAALLTARARMTVINGEIAWRSK